jgi:3-mercaptopyruvate sulfurtransferase SseA
MSDKKPLMSFGNNYNRLVQALLIKGCIPMTRNTIIAGIMVFVCLLALVSLGALAQEEGGAPPSFPSIKCEELKKMIDRKADDIVVVCNDPLESFKEGHIPGAISFPWVDTIKPPITLPRNKTLILYCSCSHEEDSSDMAAKLTRFGYRNIKLLEGGFIKWSTLKYPLEKKK